jgi:hypothetical protein
MSVPAPSDRRRRRRSGCRLPRQLGLASAALALLVACSASSPPPGRPGAAGGDRAAGPIALDAEIFGPPPPPPGAAVPARPHGGDWAVSVIGTPFLVVFRAIACAGSAVIAAPSAAVLALDQRVYREEVPGLGDTVAGYCGAPWVLVPPADG